MDTGSSFLVWSCGDTQQIKFRQTEWIVMKKAILGFAPSWLHCLWKDYCWCLFITCKCLIDILAINYWFASSYEQLSASIKNSGSFHHAHRSCDKLLALNWIKLNSQNQFSDSSIHKYDFKICFPWILKLDIHCFCRQSSQLTYSLEYLWKAYTKRVWTASKWIHLNTKMNICSLPSFHFIVFYEVFAQLWLQSRLYRLLGLKRTDREW